MAMARWLYAMLRNCNATSYALNKTRMIRLAELSRDQLVELRQTLAIAYDHRSLGTLQLFRTAAQVGARPKDIPVREHDGCSSQRPSQDGCIPFEPGLEASPYPFYGGGSERRRGG